MSYQIRCLNWNGGLSNVLQLDGEKVTIHHCLDQFDWEDERVNEWLDTIEDSVAREFPSFLEGVDPSLILDNVKKSEVYSGAALFHCPNDSFIFVEKTIKKFRLLEGDSFVKFVSVVGNAEVPESHIVGKKYTYILSLSDSDRTRAFPNELFNEHNDEYDVYYTYYETLESSEGTVGIPF
jgi:hypothetical protein